MYVLKISEIQEEWPVQEIYNLKEYLDVNRATENFGKSADWLCVDGLLYILKNIKVQSEINLPVVVFDQMSNRSEFMKFLCGHNFSFIKLFTIRRIDQNVYLINHKKYISLNYINDICNVLKDPFEIVSIILGTTRKARVLTWFD